jgi:predicted carbohydrate-binding protein with CBM5 and CBM33 domain
MKKFYPPIISLAAGAFFAASIVLFNGCKTSTIQATEAGEAVAAALIAGAQKGYTNLVQLQAAAGTPVSSNTQAAVSKALTDAQNADAAAQAATQSAAALGNTNVAANLISAQAIAADIGTAEALVTLIQGLFPTLKL